MEALSIKPTQPAAGVDQVLSGAPSAGPTPPAAGENAVIWTLWLTYGAFYFCRTNISAAAPGLKSSVGEGGMGLTGDEVGWILAAAKIAYGVGQLVNGQLSERIPPRIMLAVGMFGSAALNVLFGLSAGFWFLLFVWATNGFCQSLGWTPCVRVAANWIPVERRGHAVGIIGTGYQFTLGLTYLIASQAAQAFGWRGAVWVPSIFLTLVGLFMVIFLRERPDVVSAAPPHTTGKSLASGRQASFADGLYWTLYNPTLWLLGLSLGLLNACRYGYIDWGLTHLMERQEMPVGKAGLQYFVIAIGAAAGSYLAGWATDRFFGSRRAPVMCLLMVLLGAMSLVYDSVVNYSAVGTMVMLVAIGFCIFGPQVLLVGTAPADMAHRGTSGAAAGFVNFMGYMGAATGDVVTGYYSSPKHGGWEVVFHIMAGWALAGAVITALLWNATSRRIGLLPAAFPKLAAVATLGVAAVAVSLGGQPLLLQVVSYAAVAVLLGTFAIRWAALPAMAIASAGVLTVFVLFAKSGEETIAWHQVAAMVGYGLTMITTLMILVERKGATCESS